MENINHKFVQKLCFYHINEVIYETSIRKLLSEN